MSYSPTQASSAVVSALSRIKAQQPERGPPAGLPTGAQQTLDGFVSARRAHAFIQSAPKCFDAACCAGASESAGKRQLLGQYVYYRYRNYHDSAAASAAASASGGSASAAAAAASSGTICRLP